jgi:hypothetical protein
LEKEGLAWWMSSAVALFHETPFLADLDGKPHFSSMSPSLRSGMGQEKLSRELRE